MNPILRTTVAVAVATSLLAGSYFIGRNAGPSPPAGGTVGAVGASARRVLYYRAPMSADTSPVPKKDPMGMDYMPVYDGDAAAAPGAVVLDPARVQTLGVRTEPVQRGAQHTALRASATIAIDETREYVVAPRFEGWVAHLYANQTGMSVRAGQPLLSIYSPPLAAARQEIALADEAARRLAASDAAGAASMRRLRDAAVQRMRNWEVDAGGGANVVYRSKVSGVLIDKPVLPGARFEAGDAILKVADLSTVWAVAHVPADQALLVAPGRTAAFTSSALPGETIRGRVGFVQPVVDTAARTVDVRVELPNRDGRLRPGLFGQIEVAAPTVEVLTVPASAVIDSGTRQVVLLEAAPGRYAPREIGVGRRFGERIEVVAGLEPGERVVTSANFLIDAESNLQSALQGLGASTTPAAATPAPVTRATEAAVAHPVSTHPPASQAHRAGHEGH